MGSVNISITEEVYIGLSRRKLKDDSFSTVIGRMLGEKDIRRCYGLLKLSKEESARARKGIYEARNAKWRDIR